MARKTKDEIEDIKDGDLPEEMAGLPDPGMLPGSGSDTSGSSNNMPGSGSRFFGVSEKKRAVLDRTKPFGEVYGIGIKHRFEQAGKLFDHQGNEIDA